MLHKLAELDLKVREAYENFDFARVVATLTAFMNADLSAFYFDIRKDALYCDPPSSVRRHGALEAIEHIFRAITIGSPRSWFSPRRKPGRRATAPMARFISSNFRLSRPHGGTMNWPRMGNDPDVAARRDRRN